jgi:site-specific DNA-adenine methylase
MAKLICSFLPKTGHIYCEPFAGRANVFWRAQAELEYDLWWLNDSRTIPWFAAIRDVGDLSLLVGERDINAMQMASLAESAAIGDPFAVALAPYHTFSGGGYEYAGRRSSGGGVSKVGYVRHLKEAHRILNTKAVELTEYDCREPLKSLGVNDTAYFDPPYINFDMASYSDRDLDHEELVELLLGAKFRWMLSEYEHPIYSRLGSPCHAVKVSNQGRPRTECLWKNF